MMEKEKFKTIEVKLGDWSDTYLLAETNAPEAYDGFGTITIGSASSNDGVLRWVLISERHFDWQVGRYASGMHRADPITFHWAGQYVVDRLHKRLMRS